MQINLADLFILDLLKAIKSLNPSDVIRSENGHQFVLFILHRHSVFVQYRLVPLFFLLHRHVILQLTVRHKHI